MSFPKRGQSTTARQRLYDSALACTRADEPEAAVPRCNICSLPVLPGDRWDCSHMPIPKCFGGQATGVAHARCNRRHGAEIVVPLKAKNDRVRARHTGAYRPRCPLAGGREDFRKRTLAGTVIDRRTGLPWGKAAPSPASEADR